MFLLGWGTTKEGLVLGKLGILACNPSHANQRMWVCHGVFKFPKTPWKKGITPKHIDWGSPYCTRNTPAEMDQEPRTRNDVKKWTQAHSCRRPSHPFQ